MPLGKRFDLLTNRETASANKLGVTSILNAPYTADILDFSNLFSSSANALKEVGCDLFVINLWFVSQL